MWNDGKKIDFMVRLLEFSFLGLGSLEPKFSESQFSYFYGGDTSSATFPLLVRIELAHEVFRSNAKHELRGSCCLRLLLSSCRGDTHAEKGIGRSVRWAPWGCTLV